MKPIVLAAALVLAVGLLLVVPTQSAQDNPWVKMSGVPTTANLYAVTGVSRTRAWAAGDHGTMLMWDGTSWKPQTMPDPNAGKGPLMAQLDGTFINDIVMFNGRDGWAVGHHLHTSGRIYRWNGQVWSLHTKLEANDSDLVNVAFLSPTDGRAVASHGRIYRWDGKTWSVEQKTPSLAVNPRAKTEEGGFREILRVEDVEAAPKLNGYWMAAASKPSMALVMEYIPAEEADSVFWLQKKYQVFGFRTPGDRAVSDVAELFVLPDGATFYLSSHKNILRMLNNMTTFYSPWTYTFQVDDGLRNFWMIEQTEGWFIGQRGLVSHFTRPPEGPHNVNTFPTDQRLTDIWMLDKDFGFIVGDNGTILKLETAPVVHLSLTPRAPAFPYRAEVSFTLKNTADGKLPQQDGHWDITTSSGTRVKRISVPAASIETSLNAGRSMTLAWNQNDDQGKPVAWGAYKSTVRIGSSQAIAPFEITAPATDSAVVVGANAGLSLTAGPTYAANAAVTFRIENIGSTAVDVGGATYTIERSVDGNWRPFYRSPASFLGPNKLDPAMSKTWAWNRRSSPGNNIAPAGKYRVVVAVPRATTDLNTKEFTLQ